MVGWGKEEKYGQDYSVREGLCWRCAYCGNVVLKPNNDDFPVPEAFTYKGFHTTYRYRWRTTRGGRRHHNENGDDSDRRGSRGTRRMPNIHEGER